MPSAQRRSALSGPAAAAALAVAFAFTSTGPAAQPTVSVETPGAVRVGSRFPVTLGQSLGARDVVTIVEADAPPDTIGPHFRAGDSRGGYLVAPADPGLYEVRYVRDSDRTPAGVALLEVLDAEIGVTAPATVMAGAPVLARWNDSIAADDVITIVPAGSPPSTLGPGIQVRANRVATLSAPTELGGYEVRYVLAAGPRALGAAPLEVVAPRVAVSAPQTATPGGSILVTWSSVISPEDVVTIVPAGAPPTTIANAQQVRGRTSLTMTLPTEPGAYEVRYLLGGTRQPIGHAPVAVGGPAVELTATAEAVAGQTIAIGWSRSISPEDRITIVAAGEPADKIGSFFEVLHRNQGLLVAPPEPGAYEVRYVSKSTGETNARVRVDVTAPSVTLSGTRTVEPGGRVEVMWDKVVGHNDVLTLVRASAPENQIDSTVRASSLLAAVLKAPDSPGDYEIRYILSPIGRVLARWPLEVEAPAAAEPAAARTTDITLSVPDRARPGEMLTVEWEGPSEVNDRLTVAPPEAPATKWVSSIKVGGDGRAELAAPQQPGAYEIRYLNLDSREIIARSTLVVE